MKDEEFESQSKWIFRMAIAVIAVSLVFVIVFVIFAAILACKMLGAI